MKRKLIDTSSKKKRGCNNNKTVRDPTQDKKSVLFNDIILPSPL